MPTLSELLQMQQRPMGLMGMMPQPQMPTLSGLLGIGNAQAADTFQANRGGNSYVAPPAYVGQSVAANQGGDQVKAQAMRELQQMGPPQVWAPAQAAANQARMLQLQAIVRGQMR